MGLLVLIPIFLVLLDLAICVVAVTVNDSCCRDAARAASAGVPQDFSATVKENAKARAQAVVSHVFSSAGYINGPTLLSASSDQTGPQNLVAPPQQFGGAWGGTYRVTTEIVVNLPAAIPGITPATVTFDARQEFPITRVEQAQAF